MTNEKMPRTFGCVLLMLHLQFLSSCLQGERGVSEIEQWRRKESTPQLTLGSLICGLCVFFCFMLFVVVFWRKVIFSSRQLLISPCSTQSVCTLCTIEFLLILHTGCVNSLLLWWLVVNAVYIYIFNYDVLLIWKTS